MDLDHFTGINIAFTMPKRKRGFGLGCSTPKARGKDIRRSEVLMEETKLKILMVFVMMEEAALSQSVLYALQFRSQRCS